MSDFNPREQTFYLLGPDGETQIPVNMADVRWMLMADYGSCINYGTQIGASVMMMVIMVAMIPKFKLIKLSQWIQLSALVLNTIRQVLFAVFYTSGWNDFYSFWAHEYSLITDGEKMQSIVTEVLSIIVAILVQVMLGIQAWAMVNLLPRWWKWALATVSGLISFGVVVFRIASGVVRIQSMIQTFRADFPYYDAWVILEAVSIFWYCVLFNSKLVVHLVKHRGVLPSRRGLSAIEVLVVTNGILMVVPALFEGLAFGTWPLFESGVLAQTSVIIFLVLGTLIAQRLSGKDTYWTRSDWSGRDRTTLTAHSETPLKKGSTAGSSLPSSVTTHVETLSSTSSSSRPRHLRGDTIDAELMRIDNDDVEKAGVHVNQEFERREERV